MNKLAIIALVCMLSACSSFQITKQTIEQGNIYNDEMVSQLHPGLSMTEVKEIMGNPVTLNLFTPNHVEYIYTLTGAPKRPDIRKRVTCVFEGGRLIAVRIN